MSENTYSLGRVGLQFRGEYDASVDYQELDVVIYEGSSYVALEPCTNVLPTGENKWVLIARGNPVTTIDYRDTLPETGTQGQVIFIPVS